jgi:hypothetical protein
MSTPPDTYIGEPEYPEPWTTTLPREGLRDNDEARIVSLAPDVCKSPKVPVPYPVVDFCGHDASYTPSVRFTTQKAMVLRSHTTHVHGDEPGVGKGVKSGTVGGISEPIGHASQVRAEGSEVIRHLDRFYMNDRNTFGEAVFVRDMGVYPAPKDTDPVRGSLRLARADGAQALAEPERAPRPAPQPAPRQPGQVIRPDPPQWRRPPPTAPKPPAPGSLLGRLGRFGIRRIPLVDLLWPSPLADGTLPDWFHDLQSPNPDRRRAAEEAQRRHRDNPELRQELEEWYRNETEGLPRPAPVPVPAPDTTRVDRQKCYVLPLSFTTPALGTVTEMRRQLAFQQATLNAKNPCQAAADIAQYPVNKPIGEAARRAERRRLIQQDAAMRRQVLPSLTADEARTLAEAAATGKDAIHTLDMVAGGKPLVFSGLGGSSENRSIGSQWRGGKAGQLATYAQDQCRNGCPSMQISLSAT